MPSLTLLIFFKSTRFLHTRRPRWTFYCVGWHQCMLFIRFSRLTSWKWNMHSKWVARKVTRFSTCFLQLGEEKRTQLKSMKRSGMFTSKKTMTNLTLSWWAILIFKDSIGAYFLFKMEIIGYKNECHTSNLSTLRCILAYLYRFHLVGHVQWPCGTLHNHDKLQQV